MAELLMNTKLERIWKVAVIVQVLFQQLPGRNEKCSETSFRLFDIPDCFRIGHLRNKSLKWLHLGNLVIVCIWQE